MKNIAVITGASSGMGLETALRLAKRYRTIEEFWLIARRADRLYALKMQLARMGVQAIVIEGDLLSEQFRTKLERRLSAADVRIVFLVNAAGFGKLGPVETLSVETQEEMIALNCGALVYLTRLCLPYMLNGYGRILQFASSAAFLPQPEFAVYAATKAFVLSFSEALNEELRPRRISVTAVCPGPVKTEFFDIAEEVQEVPLYKRMFYAKPAAVAKKAVRDCVLRKPVSVYGVSMKLFRIAARILPQRVLFDAMRVMNGK